MNIKTTLNYLSFMICLVMFTNTAVYAQYETATLFAPAANKNFSKDIFKSSASEQNKYDLCLGMNSEQTHYTSPIFIAPFLAPNTFQTDPKNPEKTKEFYLYKRKRQNTAGWVLFIGGTAMAVGGAIGFNANYEWNIFGGPLTQAEKDKATRADIFGFVTLAGVLADLISIPFFISAHHNKRMASSLSLGTQNTNFQQYNSICQHVQPAITFKVKF